MIWQNAPSYEVFYSPGSKGTTGPKHDYVRAPSFTAKPRFWKIIFKPVTTFVYFHLGIWEFFSSALLCKFINVILHVITRWKRGLVVKQQILVKFAWGSHSSEDSRTLIGYLGEVIGVELRLLKARLYVILDRSEDNSNEMGFSEKKTNKTKQNNNIPTMDMIFFLFFF